VNIPEIKAIALKYQLGIFPQRMGQHFLVDGGVLARIAEALGPTAEDTVLEIGPGLGALTEQLIFRAGRLIAVEKDRKFLEVLTDRFKTVDHLQLVRSDILKVDWAALAGGREKSLLVAGNIPYALTSPIIEALVTHRQWIRRAVLTIQKEVADRIVAAPGRRAYSSLSVLTRVGFVPKIAFRIHAGAFYPRPRVVSAVLKLDALAQPAVPPELEEPVLRLTRHLFTHRRKTLLNGLTGFNQLAREELLKRLHAAGISPTVRAETLDLGMLTRLAASLT